MVYFILFIASEIKTRSLEARPISWSEPMK